MRKLIRLTGTSCSSALQRGFGHGEERDPLTKPEAESPAKGDIDTLLGSPGLYSNTLGVAIAQSTYATDAGSEIGALRELLDRVELTGMLVQADALHANRPFSSTSSSVAPTS